MEHQLYGAICHLYTRREGMLAAVGHDLLLEAYVAAVTWDDESHELYAEVDCSAVQLLGAVQADGRIDPIHARDASEILHNIRAQVLQSEKFSRAFFLGRLASLDAPSVDAELTLLGRTHRVHVVLEHHEDHTLATFTVHQPDFGIAPFRAMLGALKVAADVRVVVEVPRK